MTQYRFVDREDELETLRTAFQSEQAELLVIYGRRRLGKSALVREATTDIDDAVYRRSRPSASGLDPEGEKMRSCSYSHTGSTSIASKEINQHIDSSDSLLVNAVKYCGLKKNSRG